MSVEQLNTIEEMAYRGFSPDIIAINLGIDNITMQEEFEKNSSSIKQAYYKGYIKLQNELKESLIRSAKNGSNPAIEQLIKTLKELQSCLNS